MMGGREKQLIQRVGNWSREQVSHWAHQRQAGVRTVHTGRTFQPLFRVQPKPLPTTLIIQPSPSLRNPASVPNWNMALPIVNYSYSSGFGIRRTRLQLAFPDWSELCNRRSKANFFFFFQPEEPPYLRSSPNHGVREEHPYVRWDYRDWAERIEVGLCMPLGIRGRTWRTRSWTGEGMNAYVHKADT